MIQPMTLTEQIPDAFRSDLAYGHAAHQNEDYSQAEAIYGGINEALRENDVTGDVPMDFPVRDHVAAEAWRGQAAAQGQQGTTLKLTGGIVHAGLAVREHADLLPSHPDAMESLRLDHVILGRLSLQRAIRYERLKRQPKDRDIERARTSFNFVTESTASTPPDTQTLINSLWLKALHGVLYGVNGDVDITANVHQALSVGWQSEAKGAPGSNPTLTRLERLKTQARAVARPLGVMAVAKIARKTEVGVPSRRRNAALQLAEALIVGPRRARQLAHSL